MSECFTHLRTIAVPAPVLYLLSLPTDVMCPLLCYHLLLYLLLWAVVFLWNSRGNNCLKQVPIYSIGHTLLRGKVALKYPV